MYLIRVGRRRLNLEFLIQDEYNDGSPEVKDFPPGAVRVMMVRGDAVILTGADAESYLKQANAALCPGTGGAPVTYDRSPTVGHAVRRGSGETGIPAKRKSRS